MRCTSREPSNGQYSPPVQTKTCFSNWPMCLPERRKISQRRGRLQIGAAQGGDGGDHLADLVVRGRGPGRQPDEPGALREPPVGPDLVGPAVRLVADGAR